MMGPNEQDSRHFVAKNNFFGVLLGEECKFEVAPKLCDGFRDMLRGLEGHRQNIAYWKATTLRMTHYSSA